MKYKLVKNFLIFIVLQSNFTCEKNFYFKIRIHIVSHMFMYSFFYLLIFSVYTFIANYHQNKQSSKLIRQH